MVSASASAKAQDKPIVFIVDDDVSVRSGLTAEDRPRGGDVRLDVAPAQRRRLRSRQTVRRRVELVAPELTVLAQLDHRGRRRGRQFVEPVVSEHHESAFRAARSPVALGRKLSRTIITTFGRNFAVASTLYERPSAPGKIGRQTQTWVKFPEGWCVVVGHVSLMEKPAA